MNVIQPDATKCLIAACVCLSLRRVRDQSFKDALMMLCEVAPDSSAFGETSSPLQVAALNLVNAPHGVAFDNALSRLNMETEIFFREITARRYNVWRRAVGTLGAGR